MGKSRLLTLGIFMLFIGTRVFGQDTPTNERLKVTEKDGTYQLTVPAGGLIMTVPKGGFVLSKPPAGPSGQHYFHLQEKVTHLIISGWFEPEQAFLGMEKFWAEETSAMKRTGLPQPQNVSFEQLGKWNAIIYDIPAPVGHNSNIRAEWIQARTWIDIHLSLTADLSEAEIRTKLRDCLKMIQVAERAP